MATLIKTIKTIAFLKGDLDKMVKWRAFASMPEQYIGLTKVLEDKLEVEQPLLSANQIEQINQTLSEAIHNQKEVYLTYYKQGHYITETWRIEHINVHKKCFLLY